MGSSMVLSALSTFSPYSSISFKYPEELDNLNLEGWLQNLQLEDCGLELEMEQKNPSNSVVEDIVKNVMNLVKTAPRLKHISFVNFPKFSYHFVAKLESLAIHHKGETIPRLDELTTFPKTLFLTGNSIHVLG